MEHSESPRKRGGRTRTKCAEDAQLGGEGTSQTPGCAHAWCQNGGLTGAWDCCAFARYSTVNSQQDAPGAWPSLSPQGRERPAQGRRGGGGG